MYYDPYDPASYKRKPTDSDWYKKETSWIVIASVIFIGQFIIYFIYNGF